MSEFLNSISSLLLEAERRVEISAHNIANVSTPGFRRHVHFNGLLNAEGRGIAASRATDFTQGQMIETGSPLDLALVGPGFFVVRSEGGLRYTRAGNFERDSDGRVVSADGFALQLDGGGDLTLSESNVRIYDDGTIVDGERPLGRLWVAAFEEPESLTREGSVFAAPDSAAMADSDTLVRQGALESANVSNATEMIMIMEAIRQAEAGQRLFQVYDQALARTLTTIGQN
jgi:flagellar basal-body rod protein FlgG